MGKPFRVEAVLPEASLLHCPYLSACIHVGPVLGPERAPEASLK
jgi:hypothetical protein